MADILGETYKDDIGRHLQTLIRSYPDIRFIPWSWFWGQETGREPPGGARTSPGLRAQVRAAQPAGPDPQAAGALVGSSLPFPGVLISLSSFTLVVPGV